jgi:hypothetical protein
VSRTAGDRAHCRRRRSAGHLAAQPPPPERQEVDRYRSARVRRVRPSVTRCPWPTPTLMPLRGERGTERSRGVGAVVRHRGTSPPATAPPRSNAYSDRTIHRQSPRAVPCSAALNGTPCSAALNQPPPPSTSYPARRVDTNCACTPPACTRCRWELPRVLIAPSRRRVRNAGFEGRGSPPRFSACSSG